MGTRLRLRRGDGAIYLDRWGIEHKRLGGIFVHRMQAPDPGEDLHDHPWWFASLILKGSYVEERAETREAPLYARIAEAFDGLGETTRGVRVRRGWLSVRSMRLDEAHRIIELSGRTVWTLVVHGPTRRRWGFYLSDDWMRWDVYERSDVGRRRELRADISNVTDEKLPW